MERLDSEQFCVPKCVPKTYRATLFEDVTKGAPGYVGTAGCGTSDEAKKDSKRCQLRDRAIADDLNAF